MTYCVTPAIGPCCCLKLRVRYCVLCEMWICRTMFRYHYRITHYTPGYYKYTNTMQSPDFWLRRLHEQQCFYQRPCPDTVTEAFWGAMRESIRLEIQDVEEIYELHRHTCIK